MVDKREGGVGRGDGGGCMRRGGGDSIKGKRRVDTAVHSHYKVRRLRNKKLEKEKELG